MNYNDLCKSLGIDREAITKACELKSTAVGNEPTYLTNTIGERVRPPIVEDLSRFVSTVKKVNQKPK